LGLGIAQAFSQAGAVVVLASRSQEWVDEAVKQIQKQGGQASGMVVDVAQMGEIQALARYALSQHRKIDIWVNNAGTAGPYGPTVDFTPQDFHRVVQTNILGVYNGSRTAMEHFLSQRSGKLINILGAGSNRPLPWQNAYGSSKTWIRSFTIALAKETRKSGVGVYAFNPGMVLTDLLTDVSVIEGSQGRLKVFPTIVRMWAKPVEIPARKAVWIASRATDGKTGLVISLLSPWAMLGGALKEGLRALTRRPARDMGIRVKVIPPYRENEG
jgi:glucose 1-dehydrogenase